MRYPFATLLLLACGTALAQSERPERAAAARIALVDRVVAVVNKEVITQYELAERMNRVLKDLQRRGLIARRDGQALGLVVPLVVLGRGLRGPVLSDPS